MFLLDTSVVSDAQRRLPKPTSWLVSVNPFDVYLSVITIGEIERGVEGVRHSNAVKSANLAVWLGDLRRENADRILPVTQEIALLWGRLSATRKIGDADGLIAATARVHQLIVVTRNVADFEGTGVTVLNPWDL